MKRLATLIAGLAVLLLSPVATLAMPHGGTYTAKYVDGANAIVLNYNSPGDLLTGTAITHNLRLYDMTGQPVMYERAKVTFKRGDHTTSTQTLPISANNDLNFRYEYPKAGSYILAAQFIDHDKQIAQAEFPLVVAQGPGFSLFNDLLTLPVAAAFLLGIAATRLYDRRASLKLPPFVVKFIPKQLKRS